ncbi:MAG: glycosyltransferase family 4 protein [Lachnospiraceae bacterium]|nr:glycosyltransferase family 4 protein [Lachnospiraceae bacterium]
MRIIVISHEYPPIGGGGANACEYLSQGYANKGHQVTILTVWFWGQKEFEQINGVEIYRIKSKRKNAEHCSFIEMLDFITKAFPIASLLEKKNQYDICHIFFGIPSGIIGYYLKKRFELPYVIRFGGGDIPGFQERFAYLYKILGPFIKIIWKNADALVANSEGLREFALKFYSKKEIIIIPNGVDSKKFYPPSCKQNENKNEICLLFVSRLIERKGIQFLIPKLYDIEKKTGKKIHLIIVGNGPYREKLQKVTEEANALNYVTFAGQKSKSELLLYYQSADIFILPSKREGMPNVVLEAMACGLPIIMTACEGSRELVKMNGMICGGDLADTVIQMISKDKLCIMGAESRMMVETSFSWDNVTKQYLSIFEEINQTIKSD